VVYLAGLLAGAAIGLGWVLQQRVAALAPRHELLHPRLLLRLIRQPLWCLGILAMLVGNMLWVWTLYLGTVSLVEPLLSSSLVFAFLFSAAFSRHRPSPRGVVGALLVCGALSGFVIVADAQGDDAATARLGAVLLACLAVALVATVLARWRGRSWRSASVRFALAAGVLYGLQDAAARWALVDADRHGVAALLASSGTYVVLATALGGLLLSQSAFAAARLEVSLPPMVVAEPIAGIALGVALLGDRVAHTPLALAGELACLLAMVAGTALIGRSGALRLPQPAGLGPAAVSSVAIAGRSGSPPST
jgi:uncharacterized membrane protein